MIHLNPVTAATSAAGDQQGDVLVQRDRHRRHRDRLGGGRAGAAAAPEAAQRAQAEVVGQQRRPQQPRILPRSQPGGQAVASRHGRRGSSGGRRIRPSSGKCLPFKLPVSSKFLFRFNSDPLKILIGKQIRVWLQEDLIASRAESD